MKSKTKRMLSMLIALCMLVTLAIPQVAMAQTDDITILYTNDVHTYIDNDKDTEWKYSELAALKKELGNDVLLVDAGDHIQGTAYGSMDEGKTIIELMTAAGYDAATLGNHEFDYGMKRALEVANNGAFPYLSCNFYNEKDGVRGDNVLDSYKIFEVGGAKVAIVGVTTPESFTKSTPAYFQDENGKYIYGIAGGTDGAALYADVQKAIDNAKAAGADYVIGLGHLGVDSSSAPWRSSDVIAHTAGFDAFIDGHSHTKIDVGTTVKDKNNEDVVLTQTGSYLSTVGKMTIAADGTITTEFVATKPAADPAAGTIENAWITEINTQLGKVVGFAKVTFDNYDKDGNRLVRSQETNTGDFAADALYYLFDDMDLDVDVAIMNGGGVRNKAITGELSYLSCKEIHTFGNVACLQQVTGQQILDALEWGAKSCGTAENGGFLHASGLTYEIDTTIPSTVQADDKGVWTGGPTGEYRVKNVKVLDKKTGNYVPLDVNAKYNLAGYNYTLRDLGDGFAMFDGAVNIVDYVMEDYMVLANYVQSFPKDPTTGLPTITAENSPYGDVNGNGRIKVLDENSVVDPGDTEEPTVPGDTDETQKPDGEVPPTGNDDLTKTGDVTQIELWLMIAVLSAAAIAGGYAVRRKEN